MSPALPKQAFLAPPEVNKAPLLRGVDTPWEHLAGAFVELGSGDLSCRTSAAVSLLIRAQSEGETVAWIEPVGGGLFPPDLAEAGVELSSLVVVRVPMDSLKLARAAELLLRSGAFGCVVLDLSEGAPRRDAWQSRLAGLARKHGASLVVLSPGEDQRASLGAMVSLRCIAERRRRAPGLFSLSPRILKSRLAHRPGANLFPARPFRAPWGLR
ncbi:MAG: hypothetical protein KC416_10775 [Myxococcales bacterium]|nr:hypothetical protein [Myxococcales bacterium]